jgi:hypothetical protein
LNLDPDHLHLPTNRFVFSPKPASSLLFERVIALSSRSRGSACGRRAKK